MGVAPQQREALYLAMHGTDNDWINLFKWVNDNYGKNGDYSVWFTSQEEYYEYHYYRKNSTIKVEKMSENRFKIIANMPSDQHFYYPSVTLNIEGIKISDIEDVSSSDNITGFSYGEFQDNIMLNVDCRKFLLEHATHYVEEYEKEKSNQYKKADAIYFTNMLKSSDLKQQLLQRIK